MGGIADAWLPFNAGSLSAGFFHSFCVGLAASGDMGRMGCDVRWNPRRRFLRGSGFFPMNGLLLSNIHGHVVLPLRLNRHIPVRVAILRPASGAGFPLDESPSVSLPWPRCRLP